MNLTTLMMSSVTITPDSSVSERAAYGLEVVAVGMGVVFGVLLLLIGILQLFKLFVVKKPVEIKDTTTDSSSVSTPSVVSAPVSAPSVPASEEEQLVAIATAAIAAYRGESECSFNVISIKKIVK